MNRQWRQGVIHTREFGEGRYAEVRNDICEGWEWALFRNPRQLVTFSQSTSAPAAMAAVMREARRLGWVTR